MTSENSDDSEINNRALGCLYGQAIGDALGSRYEFSKVAASKKQIQQDQKQNHLPLLGGGPFKLTPGQITDDTELALALAHSLIKTKTFNIYDIAQMYVTWFHSH